MAQNYGYEFLMTELPTYMKQILRFSIKENGILSSVPYLGMWISSLLLSMVADWFISTNKFSITTTRKILNTIGQFGPAICLCAVSFTGCNRVLTVFLLTVGISFNGGIYSGFKVSFKLNKGRGQISHTKTNIHTFRLIILIFLRDSLEF